MHVFVDLEDIEVYSASHIGAETDSYPGRMWVGLQVSRWICIVPEGRLLEYMELSERRITGEEFELVPERVPKPSDISVAGASSSGVEAAA